MAHLFDIRSLIIAVVLSAAAGFMLAAETPNSKIEGTFYPGPPGCDGDSSKSCKVNIQVYGDLARFLNENMRSDTGSDPCVDGFGKSDEALYCARGSDGKYQCHMGYDFLREQLVRSDVTC
jgi:hypothetical protein